MRIVQSTLFALLIASSAFADTTLNMSPGVSPISHDIYQLHMTVFWICVAIGILVFGAMFYAILYHRKSLDHGAAKFHSHPILEITWTIVPAIILILMAIPATKVLFNMNNNDKEDLTIKITGYQWKWHYEYLEDNLSFFSNLSTPIAEMHNEAPKGKYYLREVDHPIVVPIHKKIRFLITSNDVNHAWWVPELGVKRDAIAGFINEAWTKIEKPGTYRGQCAELCGINHAFMPIVVVATTEEGYKDWVAKQKGQATAGEADTNRKWQLEELMKKGEEVYGRICAACHQPSGLGLPPTFPALKGSKVTTGPIEKHIETVTHGVSGTAMQAFLSQLSDAEIAAVITYERNTWGNHTSPAMLQPINIKAIRDGKSFAEALKVEPGEITPAAIETKAAQKGEPQASAPSAAIEAKALEQASTAATQQPLSETATAKAPPAGTEPVLTPAPISTTTQTLPTISVEQGTKASEIVTVKTPTTSTTITIQTTTTPTAIATQSLPVSAHPQTQPTEVKPGSEIKAPLPKTSGAAPVTLTPLPPTEEPLSLTSPPDGKGKPLTTSGIAPQTGDANELKAAIMRGEKIYLSTCAVCHQPTGLGMPPTFPALKGNKMLTEANSLNDHMGTVMNGHPGTAMQAFKDQLKDQDLADVITYERNAWENNTGTFVKPEHIQALRSAKPTS